MKEEIAVVPYDPRRPALFEAERLHIHMVEADFEHWNRLLFRDYLIEHPAVAEE